MIAVDVEVAGRVVNLSSPDKVMFPEPGLTKLDVVDYYRRVEQPLMTAIRGRPVLHAALPERGRGLELLPEAGAEGTTRLARDVGGEHARTAPRRRHWSQPTSRTSCGR